MKTHTTPVLTLSAFALLCGLAVAAEPATAMMSRAAACRSEPRNQRAYERGQESGASIVRQAWAALGGCRELGELRRVVDDNLSRLTRNKENSLYVKCRYWGLTDGVEEELARLESSCRGSGSK